MRRLIIVGWAPCVLFLGCNDSIANPGIDWPSPDQIAGGRLSGRCVVLDGLRCWRPAGPRVEITDPWDALLLQRDVYRPEPIPPIDVGDEVVAIDGWTYVRCVVLGTGAVKCWGTNSLFILGVPGDETAIIGDDASERGAGMPTIDLGTGLRAENIEARGRSACVRFDDGRVKCWGAASATLGLGADTTLGDEPGELGESLPFVDLGTDVRAAGLAGSGGHTCIWTADGRAKCWGGNERGELGIESLDGTPVGDEPGEMGDDLPFIDLGEDVRIVQVSPGPDHTCALTDDGRVKCWGGNSNIDEDDPHVPGVPEPYYFGRLGLGNKADRVAPLGDALPYVELGEDFRAVAIATYETSSCAVSDEGGLKCWGCCSSDLGYGLDLAELGDEPGEMGDALPYVDLGPGRTVKMLDSLHPCVLLDDDSARCLRPDDEGNGTTLEVSSEVLLGAE